MENTNLDILVSQAYQRFQERNNKPRWSNQEEFIRELQRVIVPELWEMLGIEIIYNPQKQWGKFKFHGEEFIILPNQEGITIKSLLDEDSIGLDFCMDANYCQEQILVFLGKKESKLNSYSFVVAVEVNITVRGKEETQAASDALGQVQEMLSAYNMKAIVYGAKRSSKLL